jgi:hypothetical protein
MSDSPECRATQELAAELALGILTGEERARALEHLARCPRCRKLVDELSDVADGVVALAPSHEPPVGFESRVIERLEGGATRRRGRRALAAALAAALVAGGAAVVLTLAATGAERELGARYRQTLDVADGYYFTAAPLRQAGRKGAGHVFGYQGSPSWVFVSVSDAARSGRYRIQIVTARGRRALGWVRVRAGGGSWGGTLPVDLHDVEAVVLDGGGERLRADF